MGWNGIQFSLSYQCRCCIRNGQGDMRILAEPLPQFRIPPATDKRAEPFEQAVQHSVVPIPTRLE
jgi:hypothetical protein